MDDVRLYIRELTFRSGGSIQLDGDETVLVLGPNNCGKSTMLANLFHLLHAKPSGLVVSNIAVAAEGSVEKVVERARANVGKIGSTSAAQNERWRQEGIVRTEWERVCKDGRLGFSIGPLMTTLLRATGRQQALAAVDRIDRVSGQPENPIQALYGDEDLELAISDHCKRVFGFDLVVDRVGARKLHLRWGTRPAAPGGDRLHLDYVRAVQSLQEVSQQGDGVQNFVATLLYTLVSNYSVLLIDELEAFLHPPQARRLAQLIIENKPAGQQLFVATHSTDVVQGVLNQSNEKTRIVRLTRTADICTFSQLEPAVLREAWKDPLLRFSNLLDGLVYDGVVLCESDSDCRFYEALLSPQEGALPPAILFGHVGGKDRLHKIVTALNPLGIPVAVIGDFDLLSEEEPLRSIFASLGGDWEAVAGDWTTVSASVREKKDPPPRREEVRRRVNEILDGSTDERLDAVLARRVRETVRFGSGWKEAKRTGSEYVPSGDATNALKRIMSALADKNLQIVPVGELESWDRTVAGVHGPNWVNAVVEKYRDLKTANELDAARTFVESVIAHLVPQEP